MTASARSGRVFAVQDLGRGGEAALGVQRDLQGRGGVAALPAPAGRQAPVPPAVESGLANRSISHSSA